MTTFLPHFDVPPYKLSGTVYGTLLNHRKALEALGESVEQVPYKGAPKAPVLYVKPRNTLRSAGQKIELPEGTTSVQVGASLGLVMGRTACRVPVSSAMDFVAGYVVVNDLSIPHDSFYRPSLRFKSIDSSCVGGPVVPKAKVKDPDALEVRIEIDGETSQITGTAGMIRPAAQLLADVTEFMTLSPGDVLLLGVAHGAPLARIGQRVAICIESVGRFETELGTEHS